MCRFSPRQEGMQSGQGQDPRRPRNHHRPTGELGRRHDAIARNSWTTFKATGYQKPERKRVNGAWDYTGQLEMEFYPKGTRKSTIAKGDSNKRILAMVDPDREDVGVVTSCGWMVKGFSPSEGGYFLKGRADSDSGSD